MILLILPHGSWNYKRPQSHPWPAIFLWLASLSSQSFRARILMGKCDFFFSCVTHDTPTTGTEF